MRNNYGSKLTPKNRKKVRRGAKVPRKTADKSYMSDKLPKKTALRLQGPIRIETYHRLLDLGYVVIFVNRSK